MRLRRRAGRRRARSSRGSGSQRRGAPGSSGRSRPWRCSRPRPRPSGSRRRPSGPPSRRARRRRADPGDDPPAAPHQVHPDRGRPGLLPGARPAAGRLRDDAGSSATSPRPRPALARSPPRSTSSPPRRTRSSSSRSGPASGSTTAARSRRGTSSFTYETIVDPRNLSPRVPDFEPIKRVETPDARTVRGDLQASSSSPGFESWAMGILPEHLPQSGRGSPPRRAPPARTPPRSRVRDAASTARPVGSGPFRFAREWQRRSVRSGSRGTTSYWEGPPNFREYFDADPARTRLTTELAFYAGTADGYVAQPQQVARLQERPALPHRGPALGLGLHLHRLQPAAAGRSRTCGCGPRSDGDRRRRDHPLRPLRPGPAHVGPVPRQTALLRSGRRRPCRTTRRARRRLCRGAAGGRTPRASWRRTGEPPRVHAHHQLRQRGAQSDHGDRPERLATPRGQGRDRSELEWAGLHPTSASNKRRLRRGRARLGRWASNADIYQIFHSSQAGHFSSSTSSAITNPRRPTSLMMRIRQRVRRRSARRRWPGSSIASIAADQPYTFLYVRRVPALLDGKIVRDGAAAGRHGRATSPFEPNRLGQITFHFDQWTQDPRPGPPPTGRSSARTDAAMLPFLAPGSLAQALDSAPHLDRVAPWSSISRPARRARSTR